MDYDKAANFGAIKTFSLKIGTSWNNPISEKRVTDEITQTLTEKGWTVVPVGQADAQVVLHGAAQTTPRAVTWITIDAVITREIQGYVSRDWAAARASKDEFWATRIARLGPIEGLRIADELRRQVVRQNPDWPGDAERHADLAAHARLSELLTRASRPRGR